MPTVFQGSTTLSGSGVFAAAATRQKWACAAALAGSGLFAAPATNQIWSAKGQMDGAGQIYVNVGYGFGTIERQIPYDVRTLAAPEGYAPGSFIAVTPSDTIPLPPRVRGIWVCGTGNLQVRGVLNTTAVTFPSVPAYTFIRGRFAYIGSATSATNLIAACD